MLTLLFWNLNHRPIAEHIINLAVLHEVDILILAERAEQSIPAGELLEQLNLHSSTLYHFPFSNCQKITLFCRFPPEFIQAIYERDRLTIRRIMLPAQLELLLVATHLPSRLHTDQDSQRGGFYELSREIREAEERVNHSNTILIGDLNANPFDSGTVSATGLHATMTKTVAQQGTRTVEQRQYPFFYNPMWSQMGDESPGPSGTYYYDKSGDVCYFWNMFDQVMLRPTLLDRFPQEGVKVLTGCGSVNFLDSKGRPNTKIASDHLPVLLKLHV